MAYLKRNTKSVNGIMTKYNWSMISSHFNINRLSLQTKDKRIATRYLNKVNELEKESKLFPDAKDWLTEVYLICGRSDLIPNSNNLVPNLSVGFNEMIAAKKMYGTITSQQTIDCYSYACKLMILIVGNVKVNQLSRSHQAKIESYLHKNYESAHTINIRVRNMMQFLNWCVEQEYIDKLPFKIKQIKTSGLNKSWIKPDVFKEIVSGMGLEYRAFCEVAYHTGLRLRELNTNPSDTAYRGLYHTIKRVETNGIRLWQIEVNGKGGKIERIILPDEIKPMYNIMVSNRFHPATLSKKFKQACTTAGQPHLRFHDIRHSFCSNKSLDTTDAFLLQMQMRHSSLATTQNYLNDNQLKWVKQVDNVKVIA
jgi:integrase|tara:strand:+ start:362 stop:1462 length:1101 start_codon:yes stop_codon:yes gene_type:complete